MYIEIRACYYPGEPEIRGLEGLKKSQRRPRLAEFVDLSSDCGLVLCTKHSRSDCPCRAIRGQTEYFRATAARKYLVSPRIADCAPGLAAGFDSFTVSIRTTEMPRQS